MISATTASATPRIGTLAMHRATEVVDDDRCAAAGEVEGVEPPEASARARHDRYLPPEVDHDR